MTATSIESRLAELDRRRRPQSEIMPDPTSERFALKSDCRLRIARAEDLAKLEWFGAFTAHRQIIHQAFETQARGQGIMLVADINDFPVGQIWVDFVTGADPAFGRLWALRVIEPLQRAGIGSRLMRFAEHTLAEGGFGSARIGVEKGNLAARRLYEQLGYRFLNDLYEQFCYVTPSGERVRAACDQWILQKQLEPINATSGPEEQPRQTG